MLLLRVNILGSVVSTSAPKTFPVAVSRLMCSLSRLSLRHAMILLTECILRALFRRFRSQVRKDI